MKAIQRLFQYFEFKQIKPTRFEKDFGLSNGYLCIQLKRGADIGSTILETIIENCIDLDITWLITGKGQMIVEDNQLPLTMDEIEYHLNENTGSPDCEGCKKKDKILAILQKEIKLQQQCQGIM